MFYFDEINGKKILKSDLLEGVPHFFTTREMFIKSKEEEHRGIVAQNRKDIADYLHIEEQDLISPSQTHSANIEEARKGKTEYPETDGLIVTQSDIAIALNFADCTPVMLYDERQNIGAVSHAGWRGTAQKIAPLTVEAMTHDYGTNPKDVVAIIGPAISKCCYNVGEEVYNTLKSTVSDFTGLGEERGGDLFVDLKAINELQLIECGVQKIDVCPYCTVCDNDLFFSYRKENATTCRHSAILKLRVAE